MEVGTWKLEIGNWKLETGNRKPETGNQRGTLKIQRAQRGKLKIGWKYADGWRLGGWRLGGWTWEIENMLENTLEIRGWRQIQRRKFENSTWKIENTLEIR